MGNRLAGHLPTGLELLLELAIGPPGTIVGEQHPGRPAGANQALKDFNDSVTAERGVYFDGEARARKVVDDSVDAEAATVLQDIDDEVERPALLDASRRRVQPVDALHVRGIAFALE